VSCLFLLAYSFVCSSILCSILLFASFFCLLLVLDRSDAWTPPSEYMAASATQAFRFMNSDSAFSEREAHLLIRAFQAPHTTVEQRRAWCVERRERERRAKRCTQVVHANVARANR
jgi:hypothetical protein